MESESVVGVDHHSDIDPGNGGGEEADEVGAGGRDGQTEEAPHTGQEED